ncbi:MAG: hypothetical protein ABIG44_11620 [Planctomycetota bacterium]
MRGGNDKRGFVDRGAYEEMLAWLEQNMTAAGSRDLLDIYRAFGKFGRVGERCTLTCSQCNEFRAAQGADDADSWDVGTFRKNCSFLSTAILAPAGFVRKKIWRMVLSMPTTVAKDTPATLKLQRFTSREDWLPSLRGRHPNESRKAFLQRAFRAKRYGKQDDPPSNDRRTGSEAEWAAPDRVAGATSILAPYFETFDEYIAERTQGILPSGRRHVFGAVERFIAHSAPAGGYFVLTGPPGVGKSAWLAEFVLRHRDGLLAAYHFNVAVRGVDTTRRATGNICFQLARRIGTLRASIPPDWYENGLLLKRLLDHASENADDSKPIIVAIDAVDELRDLSDYRESNPLFLPQRLPKYICCILTSRHHDDLLVNAEHVEHYELDPRSEANREDVAM